MAKRVIVISSSLRSGSNSEALARQAAKGAEDAGHNVEFITLKDKTLNFCKGC
ncbi:NAD(P)H-dependent oxidoreductase [Ruminococcus sp.]|uniref:NAD(P)H-dependent oxidoreductase n=1 Tax=Ruminococcus sp. TaxID=41978 RepID=UPI0025D69013|nr:NAD(P)H-dependent oxidoreductase [Ruminococcus sp.]